RLQEARRGPFRLSSRARRTAGGLHRRSSGLRRSIMYIQGFVIPVPADKQEAYREIAEGYWPIARDYGALEQVEAWEADVPDGKQTDFRRAVALEQGEKVL